jgi:HD-like signal output (HDOD) protein
MGVVSTLAQQTIKRVTDKLEAGEAPGLSEIVELIQRLSTNAYETSVQELAVLIGKDLVVTAKVIAAANTIGYNPTGREVSTITQGIHVIGFNKIRQLAVSLLLIENANRTLNPSEKREIAALALCSGMMAESVMTRRATCSPEHAFVCASLRNYGRLVMTTFMIEDYRKARIMATAGVTEDEAFNRVFGLTPLELGYHLLECAHLPDPILKSLRALPPESLRSAVAPDAELLALADLSVKMCELALRADLNADQFHAAIDALASGSGKALGLDTSELMNALRETGQQLNEFARSFGLTALADQFGPRIHARTTGGHAGPQESWAAKKAETAAASSNNLASHSSAVAAASQKIDQAPGATPSAAVSKSTAINPALAALPSLGVHTLPSSAPSPAAGPTAAAPLPSVQESEAAFQRAFQTGIEQIAGLLEDEPVDMRKIYGVILRSALQGFASEDGVIFTRDPRARRYVPQFGAGSFFRGIENTAVIRDDDRNVFGLCLQRLEDVLIYDAADAKITAHLPPWVKSSPLASFVLLPLQDNHQPFAVLMAGWPQKKTAGFTVAQIRQVRSMLKLAGTARKLSSAR